MIIDLGQIIRYGNLLQFIHGSPQLTGLFLIQLFKGHKFPIVIFQFTILLLPAASPLPNLSLLREGFLFQSSNLSFKTLVINSFDHFPLDALLQLAKQSQHARKDQVKSNEDIEQSRYYQDKDAEDQCNQREQHPRIFTQKHSDSPPPLNMEKPLP